MAILEKTEKVLAAYVNVKEELSIPGTMYLFEELASEHTKLLHIDRDTLMQKYNTFWVVTKIKFRIYQDIHWNEMIKGKTIALTPQSIKFDRDFAFYTMDGNPIVEGMSEWCLLDGSTRKIKRSNSIDSYPPDSERICYDKYFSYNIKKEEMEYLYTHQVQYSEIDMNYHTNNVFYNFFIMNAFSSEYWSTHPIKEYEIHFIKESKERDRLAIYKKHISENEIYMAGIDELTDSKVFDVLIKI